MYVTANVKKAPTKKNSKQPQTQSYEYTGNSRRPDPKVTINTKAYHQDNKYYENSTNQLKSVSHQKYIHTDYAYNVDEKVGKAVLQQYAAKNANIVLNKLLDVEFTEEGWYTVQLALDVAYYPPSMISDPPNCQYSQKYDAHDNGKNTLVKQLTIMMQQFIVVLEGMITEEGLKKYNGSLIMFTKHLTLMPKTSDIIVLSQYIRQFLMAISYFQTDIDQQILKGRTSLTQINCRTINRLVVKADEIPMKNIEEYQHLNASLSNDTGLIKAQIKFYVQEYLLILFEHDGKSYEWQKNAKHCKDEADKIGQSNIERIYKKYFQPQLVASIKDVETPQLLIQFPNFVPGKYVEDFNGPDRLIDLWIELCKIQGVNIEVTIMTNLYNTDHKDFKQYLNYVNSHAIRKTLVRRLLRKVQPKTEEEKKGSKKQEKPESKNRVKIHQQKARNKLF